MMYFLTRTCYSTTPPTGGLGQVDECSAHARRRKAESKPDQPLTAPMTPGVLELESGREEGGHKLKLKLSSCFLSTPQCLIVIQKNLKTGLDTYTYYTYQ
eukprot:scaffold30494_cov31-Tisochrysis_lutea.AAC.1